MTSTARFATAGVVGAAALAAVVLAISVGATRDDTAAPGGAPTPTATVSSATCRLVVTADTPNGGRQDVSPPYRIVASHSADLGVLVNSVEIRPLDRDAWGPEVDWTATHERGHEESGTDSNAGFGFPYGLGAWDVVVRSTTTECTSSFTLTVIPPEGLDAATPAPPTLGGTPGTMICSVGFCDGEPIPTTDDGWSDLLSGLDALPGTDLPAELGSANESEPVVAAWVMGQGGEATYLETLPEVEAGPDTRYVIAAVRPLDSSGNTLPYLALFVWEIAEE